LPNHPLNLPSIRNIRDDHSPTPADAFDFAHNIRQPVPARGAIRVWAFNMIVDDYIGSLAGEPHGDGAADALLSSRARHQRDFAAERAHTSILSLPTIFGGTELV
jgi:hypothetical protein